MKKLLFALLPLYLDSGLKGMEIYLFPAMVVLFVVTIAGRILFPQCEAPMTIRRQVWRFIIVAFGVGVCLIFTPKVQSGAQSLFK